MSENEIGTLVLDAAFEVHKALGPGLLESSYEHCLAYELLNKGLRVALQKPLPLVYNKRNWNVVTGLIYWSKKN